MTACPRPTLAVSVEIEGFNVARCPPELFDTGLLESRPILRRGRAVVVRRGVPALTLLPGQLNVVLSTVQVRRGDVDGPRVDVLEDQRIPVDPAKLGVRNF